MSAIAAVVYIVSNNVKKSNQSQYWRRKISSFTSFSLTHLRGRYESLAAILRNADGEVVGEACIDSRGVNVAWTKDASEGYAEWIEPGNRDGNITLGSSMNMMKYNFIQISI